MNRGIRAAACTLALIFGLGLAKAEIATAGEESIVDLDRPDVVKSALEQQVGKRVKVKLGSGQDLDGKVAKVGSHAVQLTELTGMEFYDATVKLDAIVSVIVKARTK